MPAPKAPTPLSLEEASRIIARLGDLAGDGKIILIGGSALSLWHAKLLSQPPSPQLATGDIDLQGNADRVVGGRTSSQPFRRAHHSDLRRGLQRQHW